MGFGFYERSFPMTHPSCSGPTCTFSSASAAGDCSGMAGILIYAGTSDISKYPPENPNTDVDIVPSRNHVH